VNLSFLQTHRETDRFFASSGVQLAQHDRETDRFFASSGVYLAKLDRRLFHFHRTMFSSQFKTKVGNTLTKFTTLRVILNHTLKLLVY
jgi:hypothetical protein